MRQAHAGGQGAAALAVTAEDERFAQEESPAVGDGAGERAGHVGAVAHDERLGVPGESAFDIEPDVDPSRRTAPVIGDERGGVLKLERRSGADSDLDVELVPAEQQRAGAHEDDARDGPDGASRRDRHLGRSGREVRAGWSSPVCP